MPKTTESLTFSNASDAEIGHQTNEVQGPAPTWVWNQEPCFDGVVDVADVIRAEQEVSSDTTDIPGAGTHRLQSEPLFRPGSEPC